MSFLFFIFLFLLMLNGVIAVGFSPSSLVFELEPNQEECETIILTSDSETISVSDSWAENKDVEWKISLFEKNTNYHGISINYDNELSIDEREVEVCLSGGKLGEYHGVLLLREEQQGSSIVQMGIWLKLIIEEIEQEQTPPLISEGSSSDSSSSGGGGAGSLPVIKLKEIEDIEKSELKDFLEEESVKGITGSAVSEEPELNISWKTTLLVIALIAVIVIIVYNKRKK